MRGRETIPRSFPGSYFLASRRCVLANLLPAPRLRLPNTWLAARCIDLTFISMPRGCVATHCNCEAMLHSLLLSLEALEAWMQWWALRHPYFAIIIIRSRFLLLKNIFETFRQKQTKIFLPLIEALRGVLFKNFRQKRTWIFSKNSPFYRVLEFFRFLAKIFLRISI